ncbi:MAG: hypothetical protein PUA56_03025 [Bacillales bacterium]|nr:hypothetical protein [Bacillales bacterium]
MAENINDQLRKVLYGNDADKDVQNRAKRRRTLFYVFVAVLVFSLLASAYYLVDLLVQENSYRIFVGGNANGSSQALGLKLSYNEEGNDGFTDISGRGIRISDNTMNGIGYKASSVGGSSNLENYLFDVASGSVNTEVSDNGQKGSANADELLASKFYLKNSTDYGVTESGNVKYSIRIEVSKNVRNAFAAARIAIIKVNDAKTIWKDGESSHNSNELNSDAFEMMVFAQPKKGYTGLEEDSEISREPVACTGVDINGNRYQTDNEKAVLVKDPNTNYTETFYCKNMVKKNNVWTYDSAEEGKFFYLPYGQAHSFVVASWFEGSDPDHNESITGGYMTFTTYFIAQGTY